MALRVGLMAPSFIRPEYDRAYSSLQTYIGHEN